MLRERVRGWATDEQVEEGGALSLLGSKGAGQMATRLFEERDVAVHVGAFELLRHSLEVSVREKDRTELVEFRQVPLQRASLRARRSIVSPTSLAPRLQIGDSAWDEEQFIGVDVKQPLFSLRAAARDRVLAVEHLPRLHLTCCIQLQSIPRGHRLPLAHQSVITEPDLDASSRISSRHVNGGIFGVVKV